MQKITAEPLKDCPECGKPELQRLVNAAAFHLKGSGWYKTDYASTSNGSESSSASAKTTTTESSKESKATSDAGTKKETKSTPAKKESSSSSD